MKFGRQQREAINAIRKWLEDPEAPQVFRLFGFAGSGKTTLAKYVEQMAKEIFKTENPTVYAAYTGKAALVMHQKGCKGATTIHSLIYKPVIDEQTGQVLEYRPFRQSPIQNCVYVTIDEVSMVDEDMGRDLEAFGKKILVLGDPFQLPPVKGEGYFMTEEPDYMMTKIHRNAKDSPIIYMATEIRKGRGLSYGRYGDSRVMRPTSVDDDFYIDNDQIIVGMNKTRQALNQKIRALHGRTTKLPSEGDRLICVRNDKDLGLLNGGMWNTQKLASYDDKKFAIDIQSMDIINDGVGFRQRVDVLIEQFMGNMNIEPKKLKGYGQFDFGDAITCHKAQGSQYGKVGIINENYVFREHCDRWYYTALTRTVDQVTVVGR